MKRKGRISIPLTVEQEALFRGNHTCCVCRDAGKDVQIHHVDTNPANNGLDNLAVLCLNCHSRVTGSRGLGKAYTPGEVLKYKASWERQVLLSRTVQRPRVGYGKELISQIDFIVCDILASSENIGRMKNLLGVLYELHLWRGNRQIDRKIVEGLGHLAQMSGLDSPPLGALVAEKLWEMCWQFIGPHEVPMDRHDLDHVIACIRALGSLAQFNAWFARGAKATDEIAEACENFFQVGLWYGNQRVTDAAIWVFRAGLKASQRSVEQKEYKYGRERFFRSLRGVRAMLLERKPQWRAQKARIETLLRLPVTRS